MSSVLYIVVTVVATTLGAATGMGGGVIIRPMLNVFSDYSAENITVLSHITLLLMSGLAVLCLHKSPNRPTKKIVIPLAGGSVLGSGVGNMLLIYVFTGKNRLSDITVIQSILLVALLLGVFVYMVHRKQIPALLKTKDDAVLPYILVGIVLGLVSSLLGIGCGFINISLLIFVFGFEIKKAAICSLLSILFSQTTRLLQIVIVKDITVYDYSPLPFMLAGAVIGVAIGSLIHYKAESKTIDKLFYLTQGIAFCLCLMNIAINWRADVLI